MPEFTVKEVRLPELHLPEIKRDDIVRSLSGVRLPEVDLAKARRTTIKVPAFGMSGSDVGKLIAAAATIARYARPAPKRNTRFTVSLGRRSRSPLTRIIPSRQRRSRWPIAIAVVIAVGVAAWAVLRRPEVRRRVDSVAHDARTRFDAFRADAEAQSIALQEPVDVAVSETPSVDGNERLDGIQDAGATVPEESNAPA